MAEVPIPDELLENLRQGNCVLFLGSDLPLGFDRGLAPPCRAELAQALAGADDPLTPGDLPGVAQDYELDHGRQALNGFVLERADRPTYAVPELYRLLAELPFTARITTCCDELLERALREGGKQPLKVVQDLELAYERPGREVVLKLHGCVTQVGSLVLTTDDYIDLGRRLKRVLDLARLWFVQRPMLYLAYHPDDHYLKELYAEATRGMGGHVHRAYIVWPQPGQRVVRYWESKKTAQVVDADPLDFVRRLRSELRRRPVTISLGERELLRKVRCPTSSWTTTRPRTATSSSGGRWRRRSSGGWCSRTR